MTIQLDGSSQDQRSYHLIICVISIKIIKIDRHQMVGKMYAQNYRIFCVGGKCTCSQHDPLIAD